MAPKRNALIRDLPPVVDLRPVPPPPKPENTAGAALRWRVVETPPGADGRPRAPRREVEMAVPGYPGFTFWFWTNYPQRVREEVMSNDEARVIACLPLLLREHNGWCDQEGEPYPPADDPGFWHALPTELGFLVLRLLVLEAPTAFPNSLSPTGGR